MWTLRALYLTVRALSFSMTLRSRGMRASLARGPCAPVGHALGDHPPQAPPKALLVEKI